MPNVGLHHDPFHLHHDTGGHPENPARVEAILERLRTTGVAERMVPIPERTATAAELALAHTPAHAELIRKIDESGGAWIDSDTVVLPGSYEAAARAAGGALAMIDRIIAGELDSGFCVDRPPGHHATPNRAMGFCLFNQIAVAARYALRHHGLERVAIVDFDVHHGNGTQDIFWQDEDVLYVSTHEYPFYPGTGHWRDIGEGAGKGTTINVSLPAGAGDADYLSCFDQVILPALHRYQPQFVLVSAGFDAHLADPLANMALEPPGYEGIAHRLANAAADLCAGRLLYVLEGGYRLEAIARAAELSTRVMLGETPSQEPPAGAPREDVQRLIAQVRALHGIDT